MPPCHDLFNASTLRPLGLNESKITLGCRHSSFPVARSHKKLQSLDGTGGAKSIGRSAELVSAFLPLGLNQAETTGAPEPGRVRSKLPSLALQRQILFPHGPR